MLIRLETGKTTIPGVGWFPTVLRIRLSQPSAGDWLAGAWADLGIITLEEDALLEQNALLVHNKLFGKNKH